MDANSRELAAALQALANRYVLANPPDHNGPEMRAAREALAQQGRRITQETSAVVVLDTLLQLSTSDAWNGSFRLDEALRAARKIVDAARDGVDPCLTAPAPDDGPFQRIVVLSDGETWEGFNPANVDLMDVSPEAFDALCNGAEPSDLEDVQVLRRVSLAEAAFGNKALLTAAADRASAGAKDAPYDGAAERAEAAYLQQQRDRADQLDFAEDAGAVPRYEEFTDAHLQAGLQALRSDWETNFREDALADAADAAQAQHGVLSGFTAAAALENAICDAARRDRGAAPDIDDEPEGMRP